MDTRLILREPQFCRFATEVLLPFVERFPLNYVVGCKGVRIAYRHFVHPQTTSKLVILVNGRAENILKWTEIAFDLYQQGYDVVVFDHRGQGYSDRLLKDPEKGYIDNFNYYVEDMHSVIQHILSYHHYPIQHILSHSMGGLIVTHYLAKYPHQIKSAVLSAPFFCLADKYSYIERCIVAAMLWLGQGQRYVFNKKAYSPVNLRDNHLSHCKTRMKWHNRINLSFPKGRLGGPTFRWLSQCVTAFESLPQLAPKVKIPLLILRAEQDTVVCNRGIEALISHFSSAILHDVAKAKHEILFEVDTIRTLVLEQIYNFYLQEE